ncbi:hypothetical protein D3C85_688590 [compost metagenome]
MIGVEDQRHAGVGGQVPEQPGVVVPVDGRGFPQVGIGDHDDRTLPVLELHHVRGPGAVGPGQGEVFRVFEMERGIETGIGRGVFVFQIELGQLRVRIVTDIRRWVLEVFAQGLVQLHPVEQQVIAMAEFFIPQRLGDEQKPPAGPGPVHHLVDLPWGHVVAFPEQQQAVLMRVEAGQDIEAVGVADLQALLAQEQLGRQIRVGIGFGGGAVIDFGLVGSRLEVQINTQRSQQHGHQRTGYRTPAPTQRTASGPNRTRQPLHSSCCT